MNTDFIFEIVGKELLGNHREADETDQEDPMSARVKRVVPFVQDTRNAMTLELANGESLEVMATLQAALKQGIQQLYQLEPNELAVEALPNNEDRKLLFFYEASEGGAGVLRQIVDEPMRLQILQSSPCHMSF